VLALSHLGLNDWTALGEQLLDLLLSDLRWDVLDEKVGVEVLSDNVLDGVALGSDLVVSLGDVLGDKEVSTLNLRFVHLGDSFVGLV